MRLEQGERFICTSWFQRVCFPVFAIRSTLFPVPNEREINSINLIRIRSFDFIRIFRGVVDKNDEKIH